MTALFWCDFDRTVADHMYSCDFYDITNCCRTYSVGREALWKNYYARRF